MQAAAYFALAAPALRLSAQQAAATHLLLKLLEDVLCEDAYLADLASLSYQVLLSCSWSLQQLSLGTCAVLLKTEASPVLLRQQLARLQPAAGLCTQAAFSAA